MSWPPYDKYAVYDLRLRKEKDWPFCMWNMDIEDSLEDSGSDNDASFDHSGQTESDGWKLRSDALDSYGTL